MPEKGKHDEQERYDRLCTEARGYLSGYIQAWALEDAVAAAVVRLWPLKREDVKYRNDFDRLSYRLALDGRVDDPAVAALIADADSWCSDFLTKREYDVIALWRLEYEQTEIAVTLCLSKGRVSQLLQSAHRKMALKLMLRISR